MKATLACDNGGLYPKKENLNKYFYHSYQQFSGVGQGTRLVLASGEPRFTSSYIIQYVGMATNTSSSTWDDAAEVALLRAISLYRPLGIDRHFHMVCILNALGAMADKPGLRDILPVHVWDKLGEYYDLEGLNEQEEGSDDDDEPEWIQNYEKNKELLRSNEAAQTRVLEGVDEEEFNLHPKIVFEPLVEPRRLEEYGADHVAKKDATSMVPSTSEDDLSDDEPDVATGSHGNGDRDTRSSSASGPRRMTRKRQHVEEESTADVKDGAGTAATTRAGKRRRNAKGEEDNSDTLSRPITTRRQQRQAEERESADADEMVPGGASGASDEGASGTPRASRGASARRQSSSANRNQNGSGSSNASPSPASRTARPRRL